MTNQKSAIEYSVVVPVYENHASLNQLVEKVSNVFEHTLRANYEIIFVDDGSSDPRTWATLSELAGTDQHVTAVRLMRNYGKPGAVLCGLSHAGGEWIVTIDDDLQQAPEDIPKLVQFRDHDVVVATFRSKKHGLFARAGSAIKAVFDRKVLGLPFKMSPLKLISRPVVDAIMRMPTPRPYIPGLLAYVTQDFHPVPLEHHPSAVGKSRYNGFRRIRQFSNLIISNSGFLLRSIALFGGTLVIAGVLLCLYLLLAVLGLDGPFSGWAIMIGINLIIGGMILMGLGFIGEYLVRLVELGSAKPAFVEAETLRSDAAIEMRD